MLFMKLIVILGTWCLASCDLLDLYVQHMDETMKTMTYKMKSHPRNRIRRSLSEEPLLRVGTFKKQRLEVDENWQPVNSKPEYVPYKEDGLDFPNDREENLDPSHYELLQNTTERDSNASAKIPVEDLERLDLEFAGEIASLNSSENGDEAETATGESVDELENVEIFTLVPEFSDNESRVAASSEDGEETTDNIQESEFELIDTPSSDSKSDPPLKWLPKPWSRVPKKYSPALDKGFKDYRISKSQLRQQDLKDAARNVTDENDASEDRRRRRSATPVYRPTFTRSEILDEEGDVILEWDPSNEDVVIFRVTARTLGYVGIGFNDKSHMKGADIILTWVDDHTSTVNLLDSHGTDSNGAPVTDASQDVKVLAGSQNDTHTTVTFSRSWETCDPQDRPLSGDTVRVLWALYKTDPELNTPVYHDDKRGGRALRLKAPAGHPPPKETRDTHHWDIKLNQFAVSNSMDTIYWCKIFKAPNELLNQKHHMIGYTPLIEKANEALVHHIILYECASTSSKLGQHARIVGASCYSPTMPREWDSCVQPVLAWSRGSKGEWLPEHVGIPIAEHREGSYYMLEVHYNNPDLKQVIDSSGVRLHLTPELRREEAGILVAGVAVSPLHLVPPKQKEYATAGYCTPHCTNTMFPETGVNVVSVVLHSHLAGRRLSLKHIRQGQELPTIVQDNHFDFDYQQSHTLDREVKILPGDELVAECVYGTLDRSKPTLGGYAASQEMCLAFVVHYPRTQLAACYSMTPVKDLFKTLGVYSFKGVTVDHLEKLFLSTGTEANAGALLPQQQLSVYSSAMPDEKVDEAIIREAESALRAMRDYTEGRENDNVFTRLVIEEPEEFRGRTFAEHMLLLPWTEELLARSIERSLYHGRHMTFCRKRDDKLALPAVIQAFPNYTSLVETKETVCENRLTASGAVHSSSLATLTSIVTIVVAVVIW